MTSFNRNYHRKNFNVSSAVVYMVVFGKVKLILCEKSSLYENPLNEILASARTKSADADEICFADEIKSTHRRSDFIRLQGRISSSKMISPTRQGGFR